MRKIAIIGAGIAGLVTAHGLLKAGYDVTLYSDRTPEQWLNESRPTGTAGRFARSVAYERELGLNHWEKTAPTLDGVYLIFSLQKRIPFIVLAGVLDSPAYAIDVRLQSYQWMKDLVERGGKLVIGNVDIPRLDEISGEQDLTIVAAGKADLANLFERDESRSVYNKPQRNLAMITVTNVGDFDGIPYSPVKFNFVATEGEAFWVPYYHKTLGKTWNLLFEAKEGLGMDRFMGAKNGHEALEIGKQVIKDLFPWDYEWIKNATLADENGWLVGKITPAVRNPVGKLPSGRIVTGVGDTLMTLDPIGGQGANNGYRMSKNLVESITKRGTADFDAAWMTNTFETFYRESGQATYTFNNILLEPLPDAGKELLIAQYGSNGKLSNGKQALANAFCNNFNDPNYITGILNDKQKVSEFINQQTGNSWIQSAALGRFAVIRDQVRQKLGMNPSVGYW